MMALKSIWLVGPSCQRNSPRPPSTRARARAAAVLPLFLLHPTETFLPHPHCVLSVTISELPARRARRSALVPLAKPGACAFLGRAKGTAAGSSGQQTRLATTTARVLVPRARLAEEWSRSSIYQIFSRLLLLLLLGFYWFFKIGARDFICSQQSKGFIYQKTSISTKVNH